MPQTPAMPVLTHNHQFLDEHASSERRTLGAFLITAVMMVVEIIAGYWTNSMALLADGWHMGSHTLALGLAVLAYACARRFARDGRFAFGTWKIEILGGYSSALLLAVVAAFMAIQSFERLLSPGAIHYREAITIALIGLAVNVLCALLLGSGHDHHHESTHHHGHAPSHAHHDTDHGHEDLNLRAAYLHVIADAATSVLAIAALFAGLWAGVNWLDPVMGLVGSVLVARWSWGLLKQSGAVLLDAEMGGPLDMEIRQVIALQFPSARMTDLHVWRVASDKYACIIVLASPSPLSPSEVRAQLAVHDELVHVTVEIQPVAVSGSTAVRSAVTP